MFNDTKIEAVPSIRYVNGIMNSLYEGTYFLGMMLLLSQNL